MPLFRKGRANNKNTSKVTNRSKVKLSQQSKNFIKKLQHVDDNAAEYLKRFCEQKAAMPLANRNLGINNALTMLKQGQNLRSICSHRRANGNRRANGANTGTAGTASNLGTVRVNTNTANTGSNRFNKPVNNRYAVHRTTRRLVGPYFVDPKMPHLYGAYSGIRKTPYQP